MPTYVENRQAKESECFDYLAKFQKAVEESLTARYVAGYIDFDKRKPRQFVIEARTSLGDRFSGSDQPICDTQSGPIDESSTTEVWEVEPTTEGASERCVTDLWIRIEDESTCIQDRQEALHKLLDSDREKAILYLAEALLSEKIHNDWVIALVFLAEDVHFPPERQQAIKNALLRIAHSFRKSNKAGADKVVWSAIRRASSLLPVHEVRLLVPFLERDGIVDARSVTLKCVEKLFLHAPPLDKELVRPIGDRAYTLAEKFLDRDIFGGGEHALLAQSAVCALAAIGDERLGEAIKWVAALNRRWLNHRLLTRLETLRDSWQSKGTTITAPSAFRNLEKELTNLS